MSEDIEWGKVLQQWYDDLGVKISELEKKHESLLNNIVSKVMNMDACAVLMSDLDERIKKLKYPTNIDVNHEARIEKLETDNKCHEMNIDDNVKEISELKEQINNHLDHFHGDSHYQYHKNTEEVLRELIETVEFNHFHKSNKPYLLSKLGGENSVSAGSPNKMVMDTGRDIDSKPPQDFFKLMQDDLAKVIKGGVIKKGIPSKPPIAGSASERESIDRQTDEVLCLICKKEIGNYSIVKTTCMDCYNKLEGDNILVLREDLEWLLSKISFTRYGDRIKCKEIKEKYLGEKS